MLAVVLTFADLPLSTRAAAAVNAIGSYPPTIAQRFELVALAMWPTDAELPGGVKRGARVPDIDRRPVRRAPKIAPRQTPPAATVVPAGSILEPPPAAELSERVSRGDTIAAIAAEFGVPWATARGWLRRR
jgi:hypothetical protein